MSPKLLPLLSLTLTVALSCSASNPWPCSKSKAIEAFKHKQQANPWPVFHANPYENQTKASTEEILQTLEDDDLVCAIKYVNHTKATYVVQDFSTKSQALQAGFIVTHQGKCGSCSNLQDLAVYLEKNLTAPVRSCAMRTVLSETWAWNCIKKIGFTDRCTDIWLYNALNTRKHCFGICLWAWVTGQPYNNPDGSLNKCLQCDEDKSGPVFKYFSGRTRRNSGINSAIKRPGKQIYRMDHCYY